MTAAGALAGSLRVAAGAGPRPPVNRNLFGKFTEHLGRNVYGGAWAQIVPNPEFAPARAWPDGGALTRRLEAAAREFGLPALAGPEAGGAPPWWAAEGGLSAAASERRGRPAVTLQAGRGGGTAAGWASGAAAGRDGGMDAGSGRDRGTGAGRDGGTRAGRGGGTGAGPSGGTEAGACLTTPVYLPAHRTLGYRLVLLVRGDAGVRAALRRPGQGAWAEGRAACGGQWATIEVPLHGREALPSGLPMHLTIAPDGPGTLELRRCLLWPDDALDGWDADVVRFMREARLPLLRFPGGNFASGYHWRDGVGPLEDRPVLPNPAWPEAEWNHVGTDEWLRLCELAGCAALICVNAGDGSADEAADWVEYCNGGPETPLGALRGLNGHPQPYGVRLWEVGNELYGSWQVGATDAAGYAQRYRRFAEAMAARDPGIRLIANGDTQGWNRAVVDGGGEEVRSLSHHCLYSGFPEDADPGRVYLEHMAFTPAYGRLWTELARPLREAGRTPALAVTEQQVFTHRRHLPNNATLTEAVWTASILNEALRSGGLVELLTHSALVNHGGGLRKEREIVYAQPVWWVTHLYGTAPEGLVVLDAEAQGPVFSVEPYVMATVANAAYLDAVALGRGEMGGGAEQESAGAAGPAGPERGDPAERAERGPAGRAEPAERGEPVERGKPVERGERGERAEPVERAGRAEPAEAVERADRGEPAEAVERESAGRDGAGVGARAQEGGGGRVVVLFLVNRHPDEAMDVACTLPPGTGEEAEVQTLAAPGGGGRDGDEGGGAAGAAYMAANSWQEPDAVGPAVERRRWTHGTEPLRLPPCSVTRVVLR